MNLARCRLPIDAAFLFLLEISQDLGETLFGSLVGFFALDNVHGPGGKCRVGSCLDEHLDGFHPTAGRGKDEGRLPPGRFSCIHIGARFQERRHDVRVTRRGGEMKWSDARVGGGRDGISFRLQESLGRLNMTPAAREVERRIASDSSPGIHVGPGIDQNFSELVVAARSSPMQGRHPVSLGRVDVGTFTEKLTDHLDVAAAGGVRHRPGHGSHPVNRMRKGQSGHDDQGPLLFHRGGSVHKDISPVLSPKLSISWPSLFKSESMTLAMGVPSAALICAPPSS